MSRLRRSSASALIGRYFTPRSAKGTSATMTTALKITADRIADAGLRESGRIVGSIAGHRHEFPLPLLAPDERHLVFGRRLGQKIVNAGLVRNRRGRQWVVARDHDRADTHRPQMIESLADAAL